MSSLAFCRVFRSADHAVDGVLRLNLGLILAYVTRERFLFSKVASKVAVESEFRKIGERFIFRERSFANEALQLVPNDLFFFRQQRLSSAVVYRKLLHETFQCVKFVFESHFR